MPEQLKRQTVDLSEYPDLVVIYLGMQVKSLRGLKTIVRFGRRVSRAVDADPDGLLLHENLIFSIIPPHLGMRQYWRDFESLETWARSTPHENWWRSFVRDPGGTAFWHEAYSMRGGIDAVYDYVDSPIGLMRCAPVVAASDGLYSSRDRFERNGEPAAPSPVSEDELYESET